nr:nucleotide-binding alpha-beta plait domain-containing protein [Tanacetum cinerariifolium]
MGIFRTKEDEVSKISTSIFVSNFPDSFSSKDLFHACKQYGHVVDSFIPSKRAKDGGVIKELFPRLYAFELHKHATVCMKLMAPSLDNSFRRRVRSGAEESQFNSLLEIVQVINLVPCED